MYNSRQDTLYHISKVCSFLVMFVKDLRFRADCHDLSKLEEPEKIIFDLYTPKLANTTYDSDEYKQNLTEMQKALDHHYRANRHHPEHFKRGGIMNNAYF